MSDPVPDPQPEARPEARPEPRWVKSEVIGGDPLPAAGQLPPPEATGPVPVPDQSPVTEEEISGARWFAVAFLAVVIPLGLVLFVLIVWGFVRSIVERSGP